MKFTDAKIRALKPKTSRYEVWETGRNGFGIRVSPHGRKSWVFMYWFEGMQKRMTFGVYPEMTLEKAHSAHAKAREQLFNKIDPSELLVRSNIEHRGAPTVSQMVNEYIEKWAKPRKRTWEEDARMLSKDVVPPLGKRKAKDIKRRDIVLLIDEIVERGSPITANRTLRIIKKMFSFAVSRGILDASPCVAIEPPAKEGHRERVLSEEEIKKFWFGLDDALMAEGTRIILKLLLVTAQRKGEAAKSEWSEIDFDTGWWTIPSSKAKNKRTHRVPLTGIAIDLLREAKELAKDSKWVFPSVKNQSITPRSISRAIRNNSKKRPKDHPKHKPPYGDFFKFEHFTPHDLRRTAATKMASLRITEHDVSKVLNQTIQTVTNKHYNHYSYDKEKQQALNKWSRKLQSIISGESPGKIVELKNR